MRSIAFFFLIVVSGAVAGKNENGFLPVLEEKLENKFAEYASGITKWLEGFNDEHLGKTEIGRFLRYNEVKAQLEKKVEAGSEGRSMKKMGMEMMPLIFHIGATSTWMLITTVLTAKSLAVGLMLLVFKIAVSSAKLAAFFTHLKHKHHHGNHHHEWAWPPHFDHHVSRPHGHFYTSKSTSASQEETTAEKKHRKKLNNHHIEHHPEHHGTIHHIPEWTPNDIPHFHDYKNNEFNFKPDFNEYKTIPNEIHGVQGFGNGFHGDFNHFEGAKKKIDTKVG